MQASRVFYPSLGSELSNVQTETRFLPFTVQIYMMGVLCAEFHFSPYRLNAIINCMHKALRTQLAAHHLLIVRSH